MGKLSSVLVVDDDPDIRHLLTQLLTRLAPRVDSACDGAEAIRKLESGAYDAAVIDIIMPDKEGIETILEARRRWPDCKLVAMTGGGRIDADQLLGLARLVGAHATLKKPFRGAQLIAALEDLEMPGAPLAARANAPPAVSARKSNAR